MAEKQTHKLVLLTRIKYGADTPRQGHVQNIPTRFDHVHTPHYRVSAQWSVNQLAAKMMMTTCPAGKGWHYQGSTP